MSSRWDYSLFKKDNINITCNHFRSFRCALYCRAKSYLCWEMHIFKRGNKLHFVEIIFLTFILIDMRE